MNQELIIEPVPGTPFVFAGQEGNNTLALSLILPAWASPELARAWRDCLEANVTGICPVCDVVRSIHPKRKTAAPGETFRDTSPFPHDPWCPCADDPYEDLTRACSPDGGLQTVCISAEEIQRANAYFELIVEGRTEAAIHESTETTHADHLP